MKLNIVTKDKTYAKALALTLARCLRAEVAIDAESDFEADYTLCDEYWTGEIQGEKIQVSRFEPVSKLIGELRFKVLEKDGGDVPDVKAVAVTGRGGSGVSTMAEIMAQIASELFEKRVLLLSFNALGGPSDRDVYEVLTKKSPDLNGLGKDKKGVWRMDAASGPEGARLNPLGRLSRGEAAQFISALGRFPGYDLIVIDVPLASPHWSLCVKAAEFSVVIGLDEDNELGELINRVTSGFAGVSYFINRREQGTPDMLSETGARMRSFVQGIAC